MIDLDQQIRDGLVHATAGIGDARPADLAPRLVTIRTRRRRTARRRAVGVAAVATVLVLVVGVAVAVTDGRLGHHAQVIAGPGEPKGFADLGPGWHALDTGPVPAMTRATLAWTGHELLVAGSGRMYGYDPNTAAWRTLAAPPYALSGMVWTGDALVATEQSGGGAGARSAWWDPTANDWHDIGKVPVAPGLAAAGSRGPLSSDYGDALVWTGQRVIDSTHGAVLDPRLWHWSTLAEPADLIPYTGLLSTNPVWDGHELLVSAFTTQPGLAWNALGTSYREVPGVPEALTGGSQYVPRSTATGSDGRVVLVTGTDAGLAAALDAHSGEWTALPALPGMESSEGCPQEIAAVDDDILVAPCQSADPLFLRNGAWQTTGPQPNVPVVTNGFAWHGVWLVAGGAVIAWTTSTDTDNDPGAPYVHAEVWVPPAR
jgi:hypothetical protein